MKEGINKNGGFGLIPLVKWGVDYLMGAAESVEITPELPAMAEYKEVSSYIPIEETKRINFFEFFIKGDPDDTIFDVYLEGTGDKLIAVPYCPEDAAPQEFCSVQKFIEQGFADNKDMCSLIETETDAPYSFNEALVPNQTFMIDYENNATLFDNAGKTVTSLFDAVEELTENVKEFIDKNPETITYAGAIVAGLVVGATVAAVGSWLWQSRKPAEASKIEEIPENDLEKRFGKYCEIKKNQREDAYRRMDKIERELNESLMDDEAKAHHLGETQEIEDRRKLMEASKNVINALKNVVQTVPKPDFTEHSETKKEKVLLRRYTI